MSADPQAPDPGTKSVFSKLPDSRPGVRSPRRRSAGGAAAAESMPREAPTEGRVPAGEPTNPPPRSPEREQQPGPRRQPPHGLQDAAWAGIAVAAEAATIGVRIANRALEALRDAGERR